MIFEFFLVYSEIEATTGKSHDEVKDYFEVFWRRVKEIEEWQKIVEKVEKGEQKIERRDIIKEGFFYF